MTSTGLVREEIQRFLAGGTPEVLCITGKWGIGKTYIWKAEVEKAQEWRTIGLKRYAYVSLFGRASLEDLKAAILEETIDVGSIGKMPDIGAIAAPARWKSSVIGLVTRWGKAAPGIRDYVIDASRFLFSLLVRKQIVCLDDLERAGDGLAPKDVLGLASFLKEERKCQVVLLLNQDQLQGEGKTVFASLLEKAIDTRLELKPTPADAVAIAITGSTRGEKLLAENCVTLGITNIRVIQKLKRLVSRLEELLTEHNPIILWQAIHTVTLLGWITYQPTEAPALSYLTEQGGWARLLNKDKAPPHPEEVAARNLFERYKFTRIDEFDEVILEGVRSGTFETEKLLEKAKLIELQTEVNKKNEEFSEAWRLFHYSFNAGAEEVLNAIEDAFKKAVETISPANLSATVSLFKSLGESGRALGLISFYMEKNASQDRKFFDLKQYHFSDEVTDEDVRTNFNAKCATFVVAVDPKAVLKRIVENKGWNPEDTALLATLTTDEFVAVFKGSPGIYLPEMARFALQFGAYDGATQDMKKTSETALRALKKIASESKINALRLKLLGVEPVNLVRDVNVDQ